METLQITKHFSLLILHWFPRILGIILALFFSLFSFDVFGQQIGFWKTMIQFLIHNMPTIILIIILIISWKWSWIGGISFIAMGFIYLLWLSDNSKNLIVYLPLFIIGALFLLDWLLRRNIKEAQKAYWGDNQ